MTCYYFKLIPESGPAVYISEPIKWSDVTIIGKRDSTWHGFNYEYSDGETTLEFDCDSGKNTIEEIYDRQGVDGLILLQFGRLSEDGLTEIPEYEGKLNLSTFQRLKINRVACSVEKAGLHDLIKSRWETKIALNAAKSIDEVAITPPEPVDLELYSKLLVNNFTKKTAVEGSYAWQPFLGDSQKNIYFLFNTSSEGAENSNISAIQNTNLGPTNTYPLSEDSQSYVFNMMAKGLFTFKISLNYQFNIKLMRRTVSVQEPQIRNWTLNHYVHIVDKNGVLKVKQPFSPMYSGVRNGQFLVTTAGYGINTSINFSYPLEVGDKVYIYGHFSFSGSPQSWKGIEAYIKTFSTDWDISGETSTDPTIAKSFWIHESVNHLLAAATNDSAALVSDFFGRTDIGYPSTGCGALNMITNGFQIRKFKIEEKPPQISLKDLITSLNALYCIGLGYEANKVRIEKEDYFYQDEEILFIDSIGDYNERVAGEHIYNNIKIGYSKYQDEGLRVLDEFNTEHEYISPIRRHDNPFSQLSSLIGSGYALEITRRESFAETQKDSTKYDDDIFLISVNEDGEPEADEAFVQPVTGVISPETSYNLRHSPKRMLHRWAKWLNSGFYYKAAGDLIVNTFVKQNGDLTTQFNADETCNIGDPNKDVITEKGDIVLAQFDQKDRIFIPMWVTFKSRLHREQIELIRDCMTGQDVSGRNYGFIRTVKPDGNQVEGWLYEMVYNPNTEEVSITMLKKRDIDVADPDEFNCLDYSDYTFADFEATPGLSLSIEQCKFENFN